MTAMRKSTLFLGLLLACVLLLAGLILIHPRATRAEHDRGRDLRRQLVSELGLTDLCLFTEARYTRHLSQADLHSAFQDHPMALEHFPSGSLVLPPRHLSER